MGNATSNQRPSQTASSTENKPSDVGSRASSTGENSNGSTIHDTGQRSDQTSSVSPFKQGADPSGERGNKKSDGIVTGIFNPHVTIQTLGSGSGPVDDATSGYYYGGMMYNYSENNSTVGATFGAALGGGGYVAGSGDALLSSLQKDLNVNALGGQIVGISRLWPGSGRMMRSYRIRVRVPRMDSKFGVAESASSAAATSRSSPMAAALPFTIELACKSFIVRSEKGEAPLRKSLTEGDAELKRLRSILSDPEIHPHVLFYARWIVGPSSSISPSVTSGPVARPVYLLRQHAHASLSDRLASRPFLTLIEKNWITYQLLNALQSLHDAGVCHGHLTTENVLLTSWNWVLISDVGCQHYKPVTLPDDDPGLWIHWFEGRGGEAGGGGAYGGLQEGKSAAGHSGNGEKKCCLAPERFYTPGLASDAKIYDGKEQSSGKGANKRPVPTKLTPAMDVFSLGCVLIELFLNGERALDLGDLMEYRRHEDGSDLPQSLKQKLDKIESSKMRAACRLMLSLDPASRLSPDEYLERLSCSSSTSKKMSGGAGKNSKKSDKAKLALSSTHAPIPGCFKSTLLPMMLRLRTEILSPDSRIALVASNYGDLLKATVGVDDPWGVAYFCRIIGPTLRRFENPVEGAILGKAETTSNSAIKLEKSNDPLQSDLSAFSLNELLLETEDLLRRLDSGWIVSDDKADSMALLHTSSRQKPLPLLDNVPKSPFNKLGSQPNPSQSSMIILLQVVFSSVRHVQRTSSKFVALKLMHRIALFSPDEVRLQRIVPFVTSLLQDPEPIVRASSIHVLASVLSTVTSFPPSDAQIFPQYVFKKVAHLITDASLIVRVAFAENIALLAETSLRFLDVGHSVSLYEAVVGRRSRDTSNHDKAVLFSEETANLIAKQSSSDDTPAPPTSDMPENITTTITNSYDSDLAVLHEVVLRWVVHITTDTSDHSAQSKQALLCGLPRLCNFFGGENSFQILPQILAFLNDRKDWQLRAALCQNLPSVCVAVGRAATEQFVIPCIESALNDDAEQVVSEALTCLSTLITLSLLTRTSLLGTEIVGTSSSGYDSSSSRSRRKKEGVIRKCAPLLLHQSQIIRCNAADLVLRSWRALGPTDAEVFVNKLLRPYLRYKPTFDGVKSLSHLSACLKTPSLYKSGTEHGKDHPAHMNRQLLQSHQDYYSHMNNVDSEVEFSLKLAHSLSVPSQRAVELTSCIPKWYESLTHSAAMDPKLSWPIFPLGFVSLQKGLFILTLWLFFE